MLWVVLSHSSPVSEGDSDRHPADQIKGLVHLIQTCKLFRGAALVGPGLWVWVDLRCPVLAKLFSERSGDKLVTAYLYPHADIRPRAQEPAPFRASTLEIDHILHQEIYKCADCAEISTFGTDHYVKQRKHDV